MKLLENKKLLLTLIFIAALVVRLGTMVALQTYKLETADEFGTGLGSTARHVVLGEGFVSGDHSSGKVMPTAVALPLYVYFLALVFSIFGIYSVPSAIIIEIVQSFTAAFTCIVFYHLGKRFSETVGLLAALGIAFYPASILFSVMRIGPTVLVVLLLGLIMICVFRIQEHWRSRDALICGVLMGITALAEPTGALFFVASCGWLLLWSSHHRFAAVRCSILMATACILCVLPWTIRNYLVFNAFVPLKSALGMNLLQGNNLYANGVTFDDYYSGKYELFTDQEREKLRRLNEVQRNKIMQEKAIGFIKADPKRFVELTLRRIFYYWSFVNPYRPTPHDNLRIVTYGPVFILAVIGLILACRRRWREGSLFLALIVFYPLVYYITQVTLNRYRYGVEAFLLVLASYATVELVNAVRRGHSIAPVGQQEPSHRMNVLPSPPYKQSRTHHKGSADSGTVPIEGTNPTDDPSAPNRIIS
jgi:4-amino-4-deoxy-L-arabinose transferase-like glycosyltransferase